MHVHKAEVYTDMPLSGHLPHKIRKPSRKAEISAKEGREREYQGTFPVQEVLLAFRKCLSVSERERPFQEQESNAFSTVKERESVCEREKVKLKALSCPLVPVLPSFRLQHKRVRQLCAR